MLNGFQRHDIKTTAARINALVGGSGPPLLLLHGYPQTHAMWAKVATELAQRFTVVAPDLRGYGDSSKPASDDAHAVYSKRAMAQDQAEVMDALGFPRFHVAGHDRGGRVAHRLAADYPTRVIQLAVLDIAPTLAMYEGTTMEFAQAYFHWFLLVQPAGMPEHLIGADPNWFFRTMLGRGPAGLSAFAPEALAEYLRCMRDPAAIHASCEDYRASATIDLEHDRADRSTKLRCPVLALWGAQGVVARCFDVLALWRERAEQVDGWALDCGHYLAEERPDEVAKALAGFFQPSAGQG